MAKVRYFESVKYQQDGVMFDFVAGHVYEVSASTPDHVGRGIAVAVEDEPAPEVAQEAPAALEVVADPVETPAA
jgi:hypothetical protein